MSEPRVVILGAGFGGLTAARTLAGAPVRLVLIDRRNHHLFQPLLYQVATAALSPGDIAYPIRAIFSKQSNAEVLLADVESINIGAREVVLTDGRLPYDHLIVATGATHSYFGHPEWEPYAPGLKTLEDALEIRRRILLAFEKAEREADPAARRALLTFVIVGAGPTGVELSGAIAEISREVLVDDFRSIDPREARVVLVEAGPRVLSAYTEKSSANAVRELQRKGVQVRTGAAVSKIDERGVEAGGERIDAATVLWAAGVAASPIARSLGVPLDRAGRVPVAPDLTVPGHPEIAVIGDLAALSQKGVPLPGTSPVAIQEGRHAARNILRRIRGEPARPFHFFDKGTMAVIGRAAAVAEIAGLPLSGLLAWLAWCFVHIFYLIGFRNRFVVMFEWAWAYATGHRGARLITGRIDEPRS
ncbi:MAG TPA: NAD(P)/FAD-dependent oxidoreductase [Thermoanaerobaculia bacterium]|nr:NAD(P)/FAD-dependent oxidoreductase [Thermoanaerobaculia bacterium]